MYVYVCELACVCVFVRVFFLDWGCGEGLRDLLVLGLVEYKNFTWPGVELYLARKWSFVKVLLDLWLWYLYLAWDWLFIRSLFGLGLVVSKNFTWPGVGCV